MKTHHKIGVVVVFLACFTGCCCPGPVSESKSSATSDQDGAQGAGLIVAKKIITPLLKTPSVADFPYDTVFSERMSDLKDESGESMKRWRVTGSVDSQNSFGAKIRSPWECVVLKDGTNYIVAVVALDGREVFSVPTYHKLADAKR